MSGDGRNVPYFPLKLTAVEDVWEAFNPIEDAAYEFNASAKHLLALCNGYNTFPEIVDIISAQFGLEEADCIESISAVLEPLTEAGMVWWRAQRVHLQEVPPPQSVFWELTWCCNLRCIHCVVSAGERNGDEPTTRELKGIAWQLARAGVTSVAYSGGEPLSRPDFFEIAEHVTSLGMTAQLATNGLLVDQETATHMARLGISAQITIGSASPTNHDTFTGVRGSWDKSMRAIHLLVASGVDVTVATIATTMSAPDIPEIVEKAASMGATSYRLIPFVPGGRGRKYRELELPPHKMRELTIFLHQVRESGKINILPLEFEEVLDPPPEYQCGPTDRIGCDGAVGYCTIGTTGEVLPCSFFSGVECDSLRDRPFEWIWKNSRFLQYFRSLNISDLEGECTTCRYLSVCRGSCRATNHSIGALFNGNAHCWAACAG